MEEQPSFFERITDNFQEWLFFDGAVGDAIRKSTNEFVRFLVINYGDGFEAFSNFLLQALVWLERLLDATPVLVILAFVGLLAYAASRRVLLSVGMMVALWFVGTLGLWDKAMQTIAIMIVAVLMSVIIGIPTGVLTAKSNRARSIINPILDLMQTIPSFVYLIPAVMLFGLGKIPAILATVIYATPPLIRLTDLGIRYVDAEVVEASRAFGANRWQMLSGVQIPLALPSIMQGINQTMMMALAMVVIASMIGARGVGETVLLGLQRNDAGQGLIGGIAIVVLAIIFDRISQAAGQRAQKHRQVAH
ncbi:proline/glycine betaine ABC transporter permease [Acuticoccus sp. MNP-M23]|uniref:ABC transporter permease n=1 Tax=Acuticoccus sp. MNP-M23 TaxID=3072793 RepID=UPI00281585F5|nr:proline/glycine betaine ABC transporter permease [Acuticoccus sp. MNP-M23]WMS41122.1 proline/glycine betaine ABC transporter permease [Acuticoccus sp. MNP-M23]